MFKIQYEIYIKFKKSVKMLITCGALFQNVALR